MTPQQTPPETSPPETSPPEATLPEADRPEDAGHNASIRILEKAALFRIADRLPRLARHITRRPARLKLFQDAACFAAVQQWARLRAAPGLRIADVGGDQSRLIPMLQAARPGFYDCTIIDTWETSIGNGTVARPADLPGVTLIDALLGTEAARARIADDSFDIVVSISVAEHVPPEALAGFFADALRICRPGGRIVHYIDIHLTDSPRSARGEIHLAAANAALGAPLLAMPDWRARAGHVSSPDGMMFRWGERGDDMALRASHQAVSLVIEMQKAGTRGAAA
jgi:2-polyprenyl-3-methyl-5-hydroxy-6-metoxy-1,4-benzoquinol methylase